MIFSMSSAFPLNYDISLSNEGDFVLLTTVEI